MNSAFDLPTIEGVEFINYENEEQLQHVMSMVSKDLSEPYSSELVVRRTCMHTGRNIMMNIKNCSCLHSPALPW